MRGKTAVVLLSGLVAACVQPPPPAPEPPPPPPAAAAPAPPPAAPLTAERWVVIRQATCDALLKLSEDDRAAASMFYLGYQASRRGGKVINVGAIEGLQAMAQAYCTAMPNQTIANAFAEAYRVTGGKSLRR